MLLDKQNGKKFPYTDVDALKYLCLEKSLPLFFFFHFPQIMSEGNVGFNLI